MHQGAQAQPSSHFGRSGVTDNRYLDDPERSKSALDVVTGSAPGEASVTITSHALSGTYRCPSAV
jgi:hypothetical protein